MGGQSVLPKPCGVHGTIPPPLPATRVITLYLDVVCRYVCVHAEIEVPRGTWTTVMPAEYAEHATFGYAGCPMNLPMANRFSVATQG